ncbi:MAG: hypothetical protein R2810_04130 [Flavobacteriales bacterium]
MHDGSHGVALGATMLVVWRLPETPTFGTDARRARRSPSGPLEPAVEPDG